MEKNENDLVKTSVSILTAALIQDKGFRLSWQANIAMAFYDEAKNGACVSVPLCNVAANRFLSQLCQTKFEVL